MWSSVDDTERISDVEVGDIPKGASTSRALEPEGRDVPSPERTAVRLRARWRQMLSRLLDRCSVESPVPVVEVVRVLRKGGDEAYVPPVIVPPDSPPCPPGPREGLFAVLCFEPISGVVGSQDEVMDVDKGRE